jgi:hypothetical protein
MRSSSLDLLARRWGWALLALLLGSLVAPSESRAGCSHRLMTRSLAALDSTQLRYFAPDGSFVALDHGQPAKPSDGHAPCSGAFCSGRPAIPIPPAPSITLEHATWAWFRAFAPAAGPHSVAITTVTPPHHPILIGSGVFHPPRRPDALSSV